MVGALRGVLGMNNFFVFFEFEDVLAVMYAM
jgi:hypothetical protein